jgi:sulfate/thiosulfate transport system substrate-binding protein
MLLRRRLAFFSVLFVATLQVGLSSRFSRAEVTLLNVSYDPTRELYQEFNPAFARYWQEKTGEAVQIQMSHAGSDKQARRVIRGRLEPDIVTLALTYDIDSIARHTGMIDLDWQTRLPQNSSPYTSVVVFLVRQGNPKGIRDWDDLIKPGVSIISADPKTSGGGRWNYLAAWGYAQKKFSGDERGIRDFMFRLFRNIPVFDMGTRGATQNFIQRGLGDVFLSWENEALLILNRLGGRTQFDIVYPSSSILTEAPVTLVDGIVDRKGTRQVAQAYLEYLYSREGQEIVAKHYYRPRNPEVIEKYAHYFPPIALFTVDEAFGGWPEAHNTHFRAGGIFDQIHRLTTPPPLGY